MVAYTRQNSDTEEQKYWLMYLVLAVVQLIIPTLISLFFFFKASFIVRKICSASDFEENSKLFAEPKTIYEIALIITGLLLIIWTLPEFGYQIKNYIQVERNKLFHEKNDLKYLWVTTAKILVGIFAILLAKQLSEYFGRKNRPTGEID